VRHCEKSCLKKCIEKKSTVPEHRESLRHWTGILYAINKEVHPDGEHSKNQEYDENENRPCGNVRRFAPYLPAAPVTVMAAVDTMLWRNQQGDPLAYSPWMRMKDASDSLAIRAVMTAAGDHSAMPVSKFFLIGRF
jgi:hypothetical protein